jgi:plasmid stabilization system protein ParE
LLYSAQQWGNAQRRAYRKQVNSAFAQIGRFPDLGILRPELGQGVRTYRVGQHLIVYQAFDTEVHILRILHVRRVEIAAFGQD